MLNHLPISHKNTHYTINCYVNKYTSHPYANKRNDKSKNIGYMGANFTFFEFKAFVIKQKACNT